jgi:epoxyqueuosine reductase
MDACPTQAIIAPTVVDSNKCISYLTIEYKKALPSEFQDKMNQWVYGCDTCQDVCPWNRFSKPHQEPDFKLREAIGKNDWKEWEEITHELWDEIMQGSAIRRTGYEGFKRNLNFAKKTKDS